MQTEALQRAMQHNTDRMCTKTLEALITLINDKRTARKNYADERTRLEVEFNKVSAGSAGSRDAPPASWIGKRQPQSESGRDECVVLCRKLLSRVCAGKL